MVPRFRTCLSPICPAVSGTTGQIPTATSDANTDAWVASAPIVSSPFPSMPSSPGIPPRSTSAAGAASLSFIIGSRLWPPAIGREPSTSPSRAIASSRLVGRWYSNSAGRIVYIAASLLTLRLSHRLPHALRRERHVEVPDPERRERVDDRVHDRGRRGDRPRLAGALDAERVHLGRRLGALDLEPGEEVGLRDRVVHHVAGHELTALVVRGVLPERLR